VAVVSDAAPARYDENARRSMAYDLIADSCRGTSAVNDFADRLKCVNHACSRMFFIDSGQSKIQACRRGFEIFQGLSRVKKTPRQ
jgi:hypothetical protein